MEDDTEEGAGSSPTLCIRPASSGRGGGSRDFPIREGLFGNWRCTSYEQHHVRAIRVEEIKMQAMTLDRRSSLVVDLGGQASTARTHRSGLTPAPDYRRRGADPHLSHSSASGVGRCVRDTQRSSVGRRQRRLPREGSASCPSGWKNRSTRRQMSLNRHKRQMCSTTPRNGLRAPRRAAGPRHKWPRK
jgi:hypothetical protein